MACQLRRAFTRACHHRIIAARGICEASSGNPSC